MLLDNISHLTGRKRFENNGIGASDSQNDLPAMLASKSCCVSKCVDKAHGFNIKNLDILKRMTVTKDRDFKIYEFHHIPAAILADKKAPGMT